MAGVTSRPRRIVSGKIIPHVFIGVEFCAADKISDCADRLNRLGGAGDVRAYVT